MPATSSEARILANRANGQKSKGPSTPEGKERSRANGLKHGMSGSGVVVPEADAAEIERRTLKLQREMAPKSALGVILVRQVALLSIRMERGAKQEFAALASRVRGAADDFDRVRLDQAEDWLDNLGDDPRKNRRKLRAMPEGVELMIEAWYDLQGLLIGGKPVWTAANLVRAANLTGLREDQARTSKLGALSRATWGDFEALGEHEGAGLDEAARKAWARDQLLGRIDQEISDLEAHYETLDFDTIAKDRAEAGDRALFDPSREACLARRYESEARRGFFKAMTEFHQAEAEFAARVASEPNTSSIGPKTTCDSLGSSREIQPPPPSGLPSKSLWPATIDVSSAASIVRSADGKPIPSIRPGPASV